MLDDAIAELNRLTALIPPPAEQLVEIHTADVAAVIAAAKAAGIEARPWGFAPNVTGILMFSNPALDPGVVRFIYADGHHEDRNTRT